MEAPRKLRAHLETQAAAMREDYLRDGDARRLLRGRCAAVDTLLVTLWHDLELPEELALVAVGEEVGPTDKSYKLYIKDHLKFYTQHFGDFDKKYGDAFIDAYIRDEIRWGYPGYPYVRLSIPHTDEAGERLNEAARREAAEGDASHS